MKKVFLFIGISLLTLENCSAQATGVWLDGGIDFHQPSVEFYYPSPFSNAPFTKVGPNDPKRQDPFKYTSWECVFKDEFNYTNMNDLEKNWERRDLRTEENSVQSVYMKDNVVLNGSRVILKIKNESTTVNGTTYPFTAAEIITKQNIFDCSGQQTSGLFRQGMIQARVRMPVTAHFSHSNTWFWGGNAEKTHTSNSEVDAGEYIIREKGDNPVNSMVFATHNFVENPLIGPCKKGLDRFVSTLYNMDLVDGGLFHPRVSSRLPRASLLGDHIYTCVWDEYFIYFFMEFDGVHYHTFTVPRLLYSQTNDRANALPFTVGPPGTSSTNNKYESLPGYYWKNPGAPQLNHSLNLIFHTFIDPNWSSIIKNNAGVPDEMQIDWVRVYKRSECSLNYEVTSSKLLPFINIVGRDVVLGTNNSNQTWHNLFNTWGQVLQYVGQSVTLRPNYIAEPEYIDATPCNSDDNPGSVHPSAMLYLARSCPEEQQVQEGENIESDYIEPVYVTSTLEDIVIDPCNILDTMVVDSIIASYLLAGDTLSADSLLSYIVDSLRCQYWGDSTGGGQGKPGRDNASPGTTKQIRTIGDPDIISKIKVYPNPNKGSFYIELPDSGTYDIRVTNILGAVIHTANVSDKRKTTIQLNENLPPGNYTIHIDGSGLQHIEKITVVK